MRRLILVLFLVVAAAGVYLYATDATFPSARGCEVTVEGHRVHLSSEQAENATTIAAVSIARGLPARAASIALAAAYQESKLRNLTYGDRDSIGLFQQRPSQGWGTPEQIMDPVYATGRFYDELVKIDGYRDLRITEAAQAVQRSGYPEAYEAHAADARALASALTGNSSARLTCASRKPGSGSGTGPETALADVHRAFGAVESRIEGHDLVVPTGSAAAEQRRGWAVEQYLLAHAARLGASSVGYDGAAVRAEFPAAGSSA